MIVSNFALATGVVGAAVWLAAASAKQKSPGVEKRDLGFLLALGGVLLSSSAALWTWSQFLPSEG